MRVSHFDCISSIVIWFAEYAPLLYATCLSVRHAWGAWQALGWPCRDVGDSGESADCSRGRVAPTVEFLALPCSTWPGCHFASMASKL